MAKSEILHKDVLGSEDDESFLDSEYLYDYEHCV